MRAGAQLVRVAVVFPQAHRAGGVERVAWDLLSRLQDRYETVFVGRKLDADGLQAVQHAPVRGRRWFETDAVAFRRASSVDVAATQADVSVSFGAVCAPGDVYWVGSIHRAFLAHGGSLRVRGGRVPTQARYLLPRHLELLALERSYFTRHRPTTIICLSVAEAEALQRLYGVWEDALTVLPNPVDDRRFSMAKRWQWRESTRLKLGMREGQVSFLFAANELHRKGFGTLVQAMGHLAAPHARLDVVGNVTAGDYAPLITQAGLEGRVHFHGPSDDIAKFYAASDVLVLPTEYEPFGLVIVEALAMGLPVITTHVAGTARYVTPEVGLVQQQVGDVRELAALLGQATSAAQRAAWSEAAPAGAAPCRWDAVFPTVERIIERAAKARGRGPRK